MRIAPNRLIFSTVAAAHGKHPGALLVVSSISELLLIKCKTFIIIPE